MEHQVPQLPEADDTFRVTQRHRSVLPGIADKRADQAEQGLLAAGRHAALREAFGDLPAFCQQLITLLVADPAVPYAEISAGLGIPIGSIGPAADRGEELVGRGVLEQESAGPGRRAS
jgi:DNA-directed RNA polymerase specialized sigma24 family protein